MHYENSNNYGLFRFGAAIAVNCFVIETAFWTSFLLEREAVVGHRTTSERLEHRIRTETANGIANLRVDIVPGAVMIFGIANRYYAKQMAQEIVRGDLRELQIENNIVVAKRVRRQEALLVS
jgi:hypothetical protein